MSYSAFHWAEKARKYAEQASVVTGVVFATEDEAIAGLNDSHVMTPLKTAQAIDDRTGKFVQLGFNAYLEGGTLVFEPTNSEMYDIRQNYEYNIDLLFEAVGEIGESTPVVIKNDSSTYNIVTIAHTDSTTPITVGELKQLETYTTDIGYRWLFDAKFIQTSGGDMVFAITSTITTPTFNEVITRKWSETLSDKSQNWQSTVVSSQTEDGVISSTINNRDITNKSTGTEQRQYALGDMTRFAGLKNEISDDGFAKLSFNVTNGTNSNLSNENVDPTNTEIALKGWVVSNAFIFSAPSEDFDDLTLEATGNTYTAVVNGYIAIGKTATEAGQYIEIQHLSESGDIIYTESVEAQTSTSTIRLLTKVRQNERYIINYTVGGETEYFRFIYPVTSK